MNLDPQKIRLTRNGGGVQVEIDGTPRQVGRIARAFPKTNPDRYVGLLDPDGREIGMINEPKKLDAASWELLKAELKAIYFVPTILEIRSVVSQGTGSVWEVLTNDGERTFRIEDRDALDGSDAPSILIVDEKGRRYRIEDYGALDRESREAIVDLLPRKVFRAQFGRSGIGSSRGGGGSSRGGMTMGFR